MKKKSAPGTIHLFILTTLIVLLSVFQVWASPTTPEQAQQVVQNWLGLGAHPLGAALGTQIGGVQTYYQGAAPIYYVVYLNPSGLVIVSADDLVEPIIGFVADATSFDPSPATPLGALVSRDLAGRIALAQQQLMLAPNQGAFPTLTPSQSRAQAKWSRLTSSSPMLMSAGSSVSTVSDILAGPLVQTLWSQSKVNDQNCYNYYTPNNYVTGCVATAMAQLMYYWQYPTDGIGINPFSITVDGVSETEDTIGGNGSGGAYNWSNMVLDPKTYTGPITFDQLSQAIGALMYDAGLSVNMNYDYKGNGGSSSNARKAADALINTFDYSNAMKGYNEGDNIPLTSLNAMVNPSLQAGCPVLFGIEGTKNSTGDPVGHAIVCDGYGFNTNTIYHHLNMGWSGQDDIWYNLPTINTTDVDFFTISACVYNVYTSGSGEIVAGQVTDNSSPPKPLSGVTVTATGGGQTYTATTNANGAYALAQIPSGTSLTITASLTGYTFSSKSIATGTSTDNTTTCGNYWGINLVGSAYVSPYSIAFTCDYNSLTFDFNSSPRDDLTQESELTYSKWYDRSDRYYAVSSDNPQSPCSPASDVFSTLETWGPQAAQFPAVTVPAQQNNLIWERERVVAVAQRYLGYNYQHHHIPDFDPFAVDPGWRPSCQPVTVNFPTAGIDCSNFSSWNYNFGLGIKLNSALPDQSYPTTPIPGPGGQGSIIPLVIGQGADYATLKKILRTGDLLYIRSGTGQPVSHVIMWVGDIGVDPVENMPLVIDSHDNSPPITDCNNVTIPPGVHLRPFRENEYYFQQFDHALRIIHPQPVGPAIYLLLMLTD